VISPLLLNIALHGIEQAAGVRYLADGTVSKDSPVLIRYADYADLRIGRRSARRASRRVRDGRATGGPRDRRRSAGTRSPTASRLTPLAACPGRSPTTPVLDDPCPEPLLDQPQDPSVRDPLLEELLKPRVIEAREVVADIRVEHPGRIQLVVATLDRGGLQWAGRKGGRRIGRAGRRCVRRGVRRWGVVSIVSGSGRRLVVGWAARRPGIEAGVSLWSVVRVRGGRPVSG
jgi:hypothetical protein